MIKIDELERLTLVMANGVHEVFHGDSARSLLNNCMTTTGGWNTPLLRLESPTGITERIIYTAHIVSVNFDYEGE